MVVLMHDEIDFNDILMVDGPPLGSGSFGLVRRAVWNYMNVAVKAMQEMDVNDFLLEVNQLHRVRHENIVKMYGACTQTATALCLVMEYMENGSLWDLLHGHANIPYKIGHVVKWGEQIANAVAYLHSINIVHRDLKPPNLLLSNECRLLKVCDFGDAAELKNTMTNNKGSALWMAPEVFSSKKYNDKCDVYSFGIVLWEMVTRRIPYAELNLCQAGIQFSVCSSNLRPPIDPSIPTPLDERIVSYWHADPCKRPSMNSVHGDMLMQSKVFRGGEEPLTRSGFDVASQTIIGSGGRFLCTSKALEQDSASDCAPRTTLSRTVRQNTRELEMPRNTSVAEGMMQARNNFTLDHTTTVALLRKSHENDSLFVRIDLAMNERSELLVYDKISDDGIWDALVIKQFGIGRKALIGAYKKTESGEMYLVLLHCDAPVTALRLIKEVDTHIKPPFNMYYRADIVQSLNDAIYLYVIWHSNDESQTIYNIVKIDIDHEGMLVLQYVAIDVTIQGAKFHPFILRNDICFMPYRGMNDKVLKVPFNGIDPQILLTHGQCPPQYQVWSKPYLYGNSIFFFIFNRETCFGSLWYMSYCESENTFTWKKTDHSLDVISDNPVLRISRNGIAYLHCEYVDRSTLVPIKATAHIYKFDVKSTDCDDIA